jgi:hypothetical protein
MASTQTNSGVDAENVPDERAGQYARVAEIGRGGQSAVWLAMDGFLGREVSTGHAFSDHNGGDRVTEIMASCAAERAGPAVLVRERRHARPPR